MEFVHLHIHTEYSLLESTARMDRLVEKAAASHMNAMAITDKDVMHGVVPFYKKCKQVGIKPIIGLELWAQGMEVDEDYPVVLLAKNNEGYRSLLKLSTIKQTEGIVSFQTLSNLIEHCFILLPYADGEAAHFLRQGEYDKARKVLEHWRQITDHQAIFMERQPVNGEDTVLTAWLQLSYELELSLVAGNNIHMITEKETETHRALRAIDTGSTWKESQAADQFTGYFLTTDEMKDQLAGEEKAIQRTSEIADACTVSIDFDNVLLPRYPISSGKTAEEFLRERCEKGVKKRYGDCTEDVKERLEHELQVIHQMGFDDYFLIVADFVEYAREQNIMVGPGRGSAAGSLVSYVLEITDVDPLHYGLLFERFLNPERITMPDIDIDFSDYRRDEVIQYAAKKYGTNRVAQIVTFGTFGARAAIRDIGRVLEAPQALVERLASFIPSGHGMTLKKAYESSASFQELAKRDSQAAAIIHLASTLEGLPRHTSVHAAGVVMSDTTLTEHVPLMKKSDDMFLTQYPMEVLEELGLLKMDFLGLKNLSLLERITASIQTEEGTTILLRDLPVGDRKTYEMLANGDTTGVFQLESLGMRQALRQIKPTEFEDIAAVNALYRPGPMENIPVYASRKHGQSKPQYPHKRLEPILAPTHGVIVYQEQIMQIAAVMAGYSFGEADLLRRAVSKKERTVLEEERERFIKGAERLGFEIATASQVYDLIVRFADYGFNRSHAIAYSLIAYQLAYLKANYAAHFYAALLSMNWNDTTKAALYLREARRNELVIEPPSINKSQAVFYSRGKRIYFGLIAIKYVNRNNIRDILMERKKGPYKGFIDFLVRLNGAAGRKTLEALIKAGALDEFGQDRAVLLASLDRALEFAEFQKDLGGLLTGGESDFRFVEVEPFSDKERFRVEKEVTGFYMSGHPLDRYKEVLAPFQPNPLYSPFPASSNVVWISGVIERMKQVRTKNGQTMAFVTLTDGTGEVEAVIFPNIYRKTASFLKEQLPVIIGGRPERNKDRKKILANDILSLDELLLQSSSTLYLKISEDNNKGRVAPRIKEILTQYPGGVKVYLYDEHSKKTIQLTDRFRTSANEKCLVELKKVLSEEHVVLKKH